uniref:Structural maintenance of chromosomes protein n=1 Tax=Ganoderma boninense TaxID=34458 RepID=A0A5K1K952_9APHY|nr:Structural maintenance of chromosomes protein [Ganoderma boninense]
MFGGRSCVGVYGSVADAGADVMRAHGIGPLIKWVDDHLFIRVLRKHLPELNRKRVDASTRIKTSGGLHHRGGRLWYAGGVLPDGQAEEFVEDFTFPLRDLSASSTRSHEDSPYTYALGDIDAISQRLGLVWEREKDQDFSSAPEFTGLIWDLEAWRVTLAPKKRTKYLAVLEDFRSQPTHTLQQIQSLHGKLIYATLVIPAGRPYLTQLEAAMAVAADHPHVPRSPPRRLAPDLDWWIYRLKHGPVSRSIPRPLPIFDAHAFSDASSGVGVAVVVAGRWRAWRVLPGWQSAAEGRDIGWLEAVGFELLVFVLLRIHSHVRSFKVFGDNTGVVDGWRKGKSRNFAVNVIFKRLSAFLERRCVMVHARYVTSASNPADNPSRGRYPSPALLLPPISIPATVAPFLIDWNAPLTDSERLHATPTPLPKPTGPSPAERLNFNDGPEDLGQSLDGDDIFWWDLLPDV